MRRGWALAPYAVLAVLLSLSVPPWPDDWDGIGFVESIRSFDLDRFMPHPPGYPVYVALLRVASWVLPSPMAAAGAVAVAAGVVGLGALAHAARLRFSTRGASLAVLLAVAAAPLVWRCSSAIGSEAPAFACASLALWGLSRRDPRGAWIAGAFVGLGLGVRASWAPLYLPMLFLVRPGQRGRASCAALIVTFGWALPFVAVVGPSHLLALMRTHLAGHASRWGGTAITDPVRLPFLLRDVFDDGFGAGLDALGLLISAALALTIGLALLAWRLRSWCGARSAAFVLLPYLAWIAVGQNLREEPRHTLPLVVAFAAALGLAATVDRRCRAAAIALFALTAGRSAIEAYERRTTPPVGAQLVAFVQRLPDRSRVMVFGGRSARFFEGTELATRARSVGTLGDVFLELGTVDRLPSRVFLTSEVKRVDEPGCSFASRAVFTRPPRIDRRTPVLEVSEMHAPFLPHE